MASGRRQIILSADLPVEYQRKYAKAKEANTRSVTLLRNVHDMRLDEIVNGNDFEATMSLSGQ